MPDPVGSPRGLKGTATATKGDTTRPGTLPEIRAGIGARHGRLDVFVRNAAAARCLRPRAGASATGPASTT
ncbi:hypothetical protein [Streptomyces kanamyceticus]|uniref:hypothetical protein n=1 Tax=Streptomyces kanamyceticus TaxID=1967 RepID=UPI0037DC3BB8